MKNNEKKFISIFWFRRDLRLEDNNGLTEALKGKHPVLPLFIFDTNIINELEPDDARISFIYNQLNLLSKKINQHLGSIYCVKGDPIKVWNDLIQVFDVIEVYANEDYEPYSINRDESIKKLLKRNGINFRTFKDQVIFSKNDILKKDQTPYTIFTPYKNKWLETLTPKRIDCLDTQSKANFLKSNYSLPELSDLGFNQSKIIVEDYCLDHIAQYEKFRNIPFLNRTTHLSPHLRFGTISTRQIVQKYYNNASFLNELIWREFFMQILYHFPEVVHSNFKRKYDNIVWRNNEDEFEKWKNGRTGYPMVDAGMRELNNTGYMHNRVRMITAGFLCKHLLIDWRWGEAYFAKKLLDYELSSNNGNWQWAAGTGCDAAPYFRVFNPTEQVKKFDPDLKYINKWIPELNSPNYPNPVVEHKMARDRAIKRYKEGIIKG